MHVERKRIFVGNLPPYIDQNSVKEQFSRYGNVISVDIKHRKDNTNENVSPVFAFVTLEIEFKKIQQCFQELSQYNWQGYYVNLELAKESFLERLKREREEAQAKAPQINNTNISSTATQHSSPANNVNNKVYHSSSSSEDENETKNLKNKTIVVNKKTDKSKEFHKVDSSSSSESDSSDDETEKTQSKTKLIDKNNVDEDISLVFKNNKHKTIENGILKIESINSTPIHVITKRSKLEKKEQNQSEADKKRKQSLLQMKNSYNQQKFAIRNALSKIDIQQKNKIIFDDNVKNEDSNKKRKFVNKDDSFSMKHKVALFDDDADEQGNINFEIKNQFEGKSGQKLLELQSRYTNDKRFTLDKRFADDEDEEEDKEEKIENEKEKQLEILESVLGHKVRKQIANDDNKDLNTRKPMLRFDPSNPKHSKFEIRRTEKPKKDKKEVEEKKKNLPVEVSKEQFYKVTTNLKNALQEKQEFNLLSMFGRAEDKDEVDNALSFQEITKNKFDVGRNPFKYDSSDTEDEQEPVKKDSKNKEEKQNITSQFSKFGDPFFFTVDDFRLNEGSNFIENINKTESFQPFSEKRRELQRILHAKIKNVAQDKRKRLQKLGKRIRIKKAKKL